MLTQHWQETYKDKLATAEAALSLISNGQTIYVGSGVGEPFLLTETLAGLAKHYWDLRIIHLTAVRAASKLARLDLVDHIRYNDFYLGRGDHIPMIISELPAAMEAGIMHVDVALVQVSPPDHLGLCSLGVSVDATKAAVENADLVIAQVNRNMPITMGDSMVSVDAIHHLVAGNAKLPEIQPPVLNPVALSIGRHIAGLITDGVTLYFDHGAIGAATLRYLDTKKDLGIHTDILTDDIMRLIRSRAVTNIKKSFHKGKTVATMVVGSGNLYQMAHLNPYIEILPIDQINDPAVISQIDQMVSIHAIEEIGLSGLARVDLEQSSQIKTFPSGIDFINSTNYSRNGFTVLAMPSTTADGLESRIKTNNIKGGLTFDRAKVHFVATEYGVVNLYGRSIRERAIALISIAHPKFRKQLLLEAKELGLVGEEQVIPPESGCAYPSQYEFNHTLKDGTQVFFRPIRPGDARRIQRMFYSLSPDAVRMRYHGTKKTLSNEMAQKLAAIDYSRDMAIIGMVGPRTNPQVIAEGRYIFNPTNNMGEFDIVVDDQFTGRGLGTLLANHLNKIAYSRGLAGVYAEVIPQNAATIALLNKAWPTATQHFDSGTCIFSLKFPPEDVEHPKDSIFIYSGRFGDYGGNESCLARYEQARRAMKMIAENGHFGEPWMRVEEPREIGKVELIESNSPEFIDVCAAANSGEWDRSFLAYGLGSETCPLFPGLFDYIKLYSSATLTAADLILEENANLVFNTLGGFHLAYRSRADQFCYLNDILLAIDRFVARGRRVAYIDMDARHGNGVQDAYYGDDRVLCLSLHQQGEVTGPEEKVGKGIGEGFNLNIPLPKGCDDQSYAIAFDRIVTPAVNDFRPSVVVALLGANCHHTDPEFDLSLSDQGMACAIKKIRKYSRHLLLLGGSGGAVETTSRVWTRLWATANHIDSLPAYMQLKSRAKVPDLGDNTPKPADPSEEIDSEGGESIKGEMERLAAYHEQHTLPQINRRN